MAKATRRKAARSRAQGKNGRAARAGTASQMRRLGNGAAQLTRDAGAAGRRLQRGVGSAIEDNPLIVGAALFVAGAALGYAMRGFLPDSEWLDEQRHAAMDKARDLARTASDRIGSLRQSRGGDPNETHS
jgi:hypothetical protein